MVMPNRYVCSALEEMRKAMDIYKDDYKLVVEQGFSTLIFTTASYRHLQVLVEEIQTHVNRMEASLSDRNDLDYWYKRKKELKAEVKELKKKKEALEKKTGKKKKGKTKPYSDLEDKLYG
jgi:FKBP-type peptidyl-prolyl cis-trans isomerase (trigger factor)